MNASNWFLYLLYFGTLISAIDPNAFKLLPVYIVCVFAPACRAFRIQQKSIFRSCVHTIDRRGTGVYRTNEHIQCKHKHTHITHALGPFIAVTHAIQLRVVPFGSRESRLIFLTPPSLALALAALNFHSLCEIHACRRDSIV